MKRLGWAAVLIAGLSFSASAETLTLGFFQSSTNNLFQTSLPEKDYLSNLAFAFEKSFAPLSFFSRGNYSYLSKNTGVSAYAQEAGLDYVRALSEKTALYLAVKAEGTIYREAYKDFNFLSFGLAAAAKSYLTEGSILKLNYDLDYKDYRLSAFDSLSHYATASLDRYFETKTTLRADLNWGYKTFFHPYADEPVSPGESPGYQSGLGVMGHAAGPGGGNSPGGRPMGWRKGLVRQGSPGQGQGIQVISLSGLAAQGIGDRLGLRVSGLRQWTLSGENPFQLDRGVLPDRESLLRCLLLERPFIVRLSSRSKSPGTSSSSWAILDPGRSSRVSMPWTWKALSLGMLRQDTRNQWEARLEKNFQVPFRVSQLCSS